MGERFGFVAGHLVEYSDTCTCGSGSMSPHEQYCGIDPVMTVEELTDLLNAEVDYVFPAVWNSPVASETPFSVYVSTQDNTIMVETETNSHSPDSALSLAGALARAASYAKQQEATK